MEGRWQRGCARPRGFPACFDRSELGRLVLERVQTVLVTDEYLQRDQHRKQPQRHRQHRSPFLGRPPATHQVGADAHDDEAGRDEEGNHGVRQPHR
jgi:hypothetical protein